VFDPQSILVIGHIWPEPRSSAAGRRMMQLLSLFRSKGVKITFVSPSSPSGYMEDLQSMGIDVSETEVNSSRFDKFVRNLQPSIVIFDRFVSEEKFGWRVWDQCPDSIRILNMEDLHCLRKARGDALRQGVSFNSAHLLSNELAKREVASIYRSDLTLVISEFEMKILRSDFKIPGSLIHYLPFMLNPVGPDIGSKQLPFDAREDFIQIGNFLHEPNLDSVIYIKNEIWPLIHKQLPDAKMKIFGAYPTRKALELHHPESGFLIKGRADDAQAEVAKSRICLAPLRFGAGLKGKLIEAMECGTPSVTTKIGAEGINGHLPWSGLTADYNQPEEIANAAVRLYKDPELWGLSVKRGYEILNHRFSKKEHAERLIKKIEELQKNLREHRINNFTGSMLKHHTMAGTKYMSRWIEAKNRVKELTGK